MPLVALRLPHWALFRPNARGAFVALWHQGSLLLVSQGAGRLGLPGGPVSRERAPLEVAARALREAVGDRQLGELRHAYRGTHVVAGRAETADIFECHVEGGDALGGDLRSREGRFYTTREALGLKLSPQLIDYLKDL